MMTNLFSTFDPTTGLLSMNWISSMIFMTLIPMKFWVFNNKSAKTMNMITSMMSKEMMMLMTYKGMTLISITTFMWILINNLMSLIPYIFTSPAHLTFSLAIAMPAWVGFMIFGWMNKTNEMFTHLLPTGTPLLLMPLMVMIETISNLIRPGSLAIRLTANMVAGHLLMTLLGSNTNTMMFLMMMYIVLMTFEMAVSMIQSYVFMTLLTLYSSEL